MNFRRLWIVEWHLNYLLWFHTKWRRSAFHYGIHDGSGNTYTPKQIGLNHGTEVERKYFLIRNYASHIPRCGRRANQTELRRHGPIPIPGIRIGTHHESGVSDQLYGFLHSGIVQLEAPLETIRTGMETGRTPLGQGHMKDFPWNGLMTLYGDPDVAG